MSTLGPAAGGSTPSAPTPHVPHDVDQAVSAPPGEGALTKFEHDLDVLTLARVTADPGAPASAGRREAVESVLQMTWDETLRFVRGYARRLPPNVGSDAEDLTQDVMINLLRYVESNPMEPPTHPKPYILRVINNRWKEIRRANGAQRRGGNARHEPLDSANDPQDHSQSKQDLIDAALTIERLLPLIPNDDAKQAFVLYLRGYTPTEAAVEIGISVSTFRSRVKAAQGYLRASGEGLR